MAKTPTKSAIRQSSRAPCVTAAVSFANENSDEDMLDEIQNDSDEEQEDGGEGSGATDLMMGMRHVWQEVHDKSKKPRSTAFQNQKAALFAAGRKNAKELVRAGTASLEEYRAKIRQLKSQEVSYEELSKNAMPLWEVHDKSVQALLAVYPSLLEDLFPRRSQQMDTTSAMLLSHPGDRAHSLKTFLKDANTQLEQSRENEKLATDATALIKHYKSLLLTS